MAIGLGDKVKDPVTGLAGIVTAKIDYLWGCRHIQVQPEELKDGKPVDATILDEDRLVLVKKAVVKVPASAAERGGCTSLKLR